MKDNAKIEQRALKVSMFSIIFFIILGLGFAFITHSDSILFDGVFSLISFSIAMLTLKVSQLAELPDDDTFHFGYTQFEPMINVFKALFILVACAFAFFSALQSLRTGGNPMPLGVAVIYGVMSAGGCFAVALYLKRKGKQCKSGLLQVDVTEWIIDGMLSFGILAGFAVGYFLQQTHWSYVTPYVDPVLLIVITVFALPIPIKILLNNMREIILMAPPESLVDKIELELEKATADIPLNDIEYRVMKHGRATFLLVHLMVSDAFHFNTVADLDNIREKIDDHMLRFNPEIVMEILFIKDREWASLK